jgi:hypothetical protein
MTAQNIMVDFEHYVIFFDVVMGLIYDLIQAHFDKIQINQYYLDPNAWIYIGHGFID